MEVNNLLDIHTREELYSWYLQNHDKVKDFWLRVNRANNPFPGVVGYIDAVEVALCFGGLTAHKNALTAENLFSTSLLAAEAAIGVGRTLKGVTG